MKHSQVVVTSADERRQVRDFLDVPANVYRYDPMWVAPLRSLERMRLDQARHPFYQHGIGKFWVAYRDGKPVGRIGATVNHLYIERFKQNIGHLAMLEVEDNAATFDALIETAETWLVERGMRAVNGPFSLTLTEEPGLLVEGFGTSPTVMMAHGRPYYATHLERRGYKKEMDLLAYLGPVDVTIDTAVALQLTRLAVRTGITMRRSTRMTFYADLVAAFEHYNEAWEGNWGHIHMTRQEIKSSAEALFFLMAPEALVFAEKQQKVVGVLLAMPNVNEWIADLGGRLLPFGWFKLLYRRLIGYADIGRIMIAGVNRELRGSSLGGAIPLMLLNELRKITARYKPKYLEGSWILETNEPMKRVCERAGFREYKRYRIYRHDLESRDEDLI